MARPLSIGARWTLRYAVFTSVVLSVFAYVLYAEVRERAQRDATLVARLQLRELAEELEKHPGQPDEILSYVESHVSSAARELRLGIRIFQGDGTILVERGLPKHFPLPISLPSPKSEPGLVEIDLGENYPYYVTVFSVGPAYAQVAMYGRTFERAALDIRNLLLLVLPPMILLSSLFGWWLVRGMLRPIAQIDEAARRISASRMEGEIPLSGSGDELDRLAGTLNDTMARLRAGVGQIRRFASSAAHELRAPISRLRHRVEDGLSRDRDPSGDEKLLVETLADIDGIAGIVRALLDLAHCEGGLDPEQIQDVDLAALLDGVADFFEPSAQARGISLERRYPPALRVRGEPNWLRQLFANLVDNAVKFSERGGRVEIEAEGQPSAVRVRVRDQGRGIPRQEQEGIFEPFRRASAESAGGVGLGLALARQITLAHGGEIGVESAEGRGSSFSVRLPRP
jgi:signal transduction histidine kinase